MIIDDLAEGLVVALADDHHVEEGRVGAVQPRALLEVLHHVLETEKLSSLANCAYHLGSVFRVFHLV